MEFGVLHINHACFAARYINIYIYSYSFLKNIYLVLEIPYFRVVKSPILNAGIGDLEEGSLEMKNARLERSALQNSDQDFNNCVKVLVC